MNNELDRIREQIKEMRRSGFEPDCVYMCYSLWDSLGRPRKFSNVSVAPDNNLIGRFEVR